MLLQLLWDHTCAQLPNPCLLLNDAYRSVVPEGIWPPYSYSAMKRCCPAAIITCEAAPDRPDPGRRSAPPMRPEAVNPCRHARGAGRDALRHRISARRPPAGLRVSIPGCPARPGPSGTWQYAVAASMQVRVMQSWPRLKRPEQAGPSDGPEYERRCRDSGDRPTAQGRLRLRGQRASPITRQRTRPGPRSRPGCGPAYRKAAEGCRKPVTPTNQPLPLISPCQCCH